MNAVVIASNNSHKVREIRAILAGRFEQIFALADLGITADVVEDADTFEGNALKKAAEISALANMPALADDSGLEVDALGGAPGVHSARYAGEPCDDAANNAKLLSALQNEADRRARFVSVVTLYYPNGKHISARGETEGEILTAPRGTGGFGYDPLFYSFALKKTFAEADSGEKNAVSHRANALAELRKILSFD